MIKVGDTLPATTLMEYSEVEGEGCSIGPNPVAVDKATAGKTTSTRFWTYVGDDEHPLTVFDFTLSRERDGPAAFLKHYSGAIQADGYSAYDGIALSGNNPRGGC